MSDTNKQQTTPVACDVLINALEKLTRLGAGDSYGNSDGNVIAQQALAVAVPDGYKLVPVEPTRAMLDAAKTDLVRDGEIDPMLKGAYRAMLAAAQEVQP